MKPWIIAGAAVLVVAAIVVVLVLTLGGSHCKLDYDDDVLETIEDEKGLKDVYEKTMNTVASLNLTKLVDLMPPEVRKEAKKNDDVMDMMKETEKALKKSGGKILSAKATGISEIGSGQLDYLAEMFEDEFDKEIDIDEGYSIQVKMKAEVDGDKETSSFSFEFIKVDGKWYLLTTDI